MDEHDEKLEELQKRLEKITQLDEPKQHDEIEKIRHEIKQEHEKIKQEHEKINLEIELGKVLKEALELPKEPSLKEQIGQLGLDLKHYGDVLEWHRDQLKEKEKIDPGVKPMEPELDGHEWIAFSSAAWMIERGLRYSAGLAEATLRGLCISGEVRSIRSKYVYLHHDGDLKRPPSEWRRDNEPSEFRLKTSTFIRPSEWRGTEVDFEGNIEVSEEDLRFWLDRQGATQSTDPEDERPLTRQQWKQNNAKKAIIELWPDGIPGDLTNPQIEQRVAEQMKKMGAVPVSRDTILRAAGRKQ